MTTGVEEDESREVGLCFIENDTQDNEYGEQSTCVEENPPFGLRWAMIHFAIGTAPDTSLLMQCTSRAYAVISMSTDRDCTYGGLHLPVSSVGCGDLSFSQCFVPPANKSLHTSNADNYL